MVLWNQNPLRWWSKDECGVQRVRVSKATIHTSSTHSQSSSANAMPLNRTPLDVYLSWRAARHSATLVERLDRIKQRPASR